MQYFLARRNFLFFYSFIEQANRNLMDVQWPDFKLDTLDTAKGGG